LRFLRDQPVRRQVIALTCAVLVPIALAIAWSANRARIEREAEVRDQAGSIATTAAAYLTQFLAGVDSVASAIALHPSVVALDREPSDRLLTTVLRHQPLLLNIVLINRQGLVRGTGLRAPANMSVTVSFPYVMDVIATGKPVVSELVTGPISGKPTIIMAYPVQRADEVVGVIAIGLDLTHLQTVFTDVPLPEGSVITLADEKGRVLARSRDAERYIGKFSAAHPVPPRDVPRTQLLMGLDGLERFYGNAPIDRGPWLLSVGIPTSVALTRIRPLLQRDLGIAALGLTSFLVVALIFAHLFSRDLNLLRQGVQRIADGDLSPPIANRVPNLELRQLQDAFIIMAANLRNAHAAVDRQIEQERKMREALQSLQRQVVRQERLAAVGVLVSGVAHELNNPLQAILGTVELLEHQAAMSPEALEEIGFIKTQSGRAREIIRNLSRFSAQQSGPPALVDLRDVIAEVVQLRRRSLDDSSIALDVETMTTRKVYANFTEIEQVTLNFVINAQQSIEAADRTKGRILIRVFDAGKKVRLEVQDDGPGVAPQDEPKLFQPFFTTKPVGKGTGLGLSVSYGIIESYGGAIGYHGNEWGGATFYFELPAVDPAARQSDDQSSLLHRSVPSSL
jgi:two-component system NtrC family sensor kinase